MTGFTDCGLLNEECQRNGRCKGHKSEPDIMRDFRNLKSLRNNRHMDEPEFDEKVMDIFREYAGRLASSAYCAGFNEALEKADRCIAQNHSHAMKDLQK